MDMRGRTATGFPVVRGNRRQGSKGDHNAGLGIALISQSDFFGQTGSISASTCRRKKKPMAYTDCKSFIVTKQSTFT